MGDAKSPLMRMTVLVPKRKGHMTLASLYSLYLSKGIVSVCGDGQVILQGKEKSA
jgi:hypothetical protein